MEEHLKDAIFEYPLGAVECLRKLHGLEKPEVLNDSIDALQEWANKQTHFKRKDFDREHLAWTLLSSKGSIERAKTRLDKYCTGKNLHSRMFEKLDVKNDFKIFDEFHTALLPKFSEDYYRVIIFKLLKVTKDSWFSFLDMMRYVVLVSEYVRGHPHFLNGCIAVLDYSEVDMVETLKYTSVMNLRQFVTVVVDCIGLRVKGIHVISPSNLLSVLMSIGKQVLSAKLAERFHVHKTYDRLHDFISKDILPADYDGKEKTIAELSEILRQKMSSEEVHEYLIKAQEFRTDESHRQPVDFNNEYLGTPGSFRSFVVD